MSSWWSEGASPLECRATGVMGPGKGRRLWLPVQIELGLFFIGNGGPDWFFLAALALGSLLVVRGFSRSYNYFWTLWGDTIVTEAYALVCGPKIEGAGGKK